MVTGLEIRDLSFAIGSFALKNVCLKIRQGEYFVLTGPNGAGKSIMLKLIAGLLQPLSGEIFIAGRPMRGIPPWQRNIGYVPQDCALFPNRTVEGNIRFGLEVRGIDKRSIVAAVRDFAELLQITHLLKRHPQGLSGGERQKISIARALILKPGILLLDEPVSSLDEDARDRLCEEMKKIQQSIAITTIHVSHNQHETELVADRVGILRDGKGVGGMAIPD